MSYIQTMKSYIPAKPLHNNDTVSVHFNNFIAQRFATNYGGT